MSLRATAHSGPEILGGSNIDGSAISWFEKNWPFCSWAIFLFGCGFLSARWKHRDDYWYGWLAMVMYCLHQSEEHAYDLRGWRYAFVPYLNYGPIAEIFRDVCSQYPELPCPLDPKATVYINVLLIWVGFGGCMVAASFYPTRFLFSAYLNWGTAVVNGLMGHIVPAIATQSYNPGVVQSLFMVPLGVYLIWNSGRPRLCLANGVLNHVVMILAIKIIFVFKTDIASTLTILLVGVCPIFTLFLSNYISVPSKKSGEKTY